MKEAEQYLQAGDIKLRAKDIKILLEEHDNMKQEIERLKEEYVMLQNASDKVEEELQQRIDKAISLIGRSEFPLDNYLIRDIQNDTYYYLKTIIDILKGVDKE